MGPEAQPTSKKSLPTRLLRLLRKPWIMATSYFLNLAAIVVSFYQFASPERHPRLTLAEDQTRTEVVKKERSSQLKVLFGGDEIVGPVSVAQLTFWNDGAMPVKTDDIL
ncbi:MAG: hypothetical protein ACAH88_05115, partial [Roseimicrobium sp.]